MTREISDSELGILKQVDAEIKKHGIATPDQVRAMVQGREELRMDAAERALQERIEKRAVLYDNAGADNKAIYGDNVAGDIRAIGTWIEPVIRQAEQAARQDERRKALETAAVLVDLQARDGLFPDKPLNFHAKVIARAIRSLKEPS